MPRKQSAPASRTGPAASPQRVVVEVVRPEVDGGRFPIKRAVGETVDVEADIHADGHDLIAAVLRVRHASDASWSEIPMRPAGNDVYVARFTIDRLVGYEYTVEAWPDRFSTWQRGLSKKADAGQDVSVDLEVGARLIDAAATRAGGADGAVLCTWAGTLRRAVREEAIEAALDSSRAALLARHDDRVGRTSYDKVLRVDVDRKRAAFSAWYEMFPRSASPEPGRHGTLRDVISRLPYIARMGFDVLYLPPVHPIGVTHRKGRNNATSAAPGDPGSPWAIGGAAGGHKALHPDLGTLDDFRALVGETGKVGMEVALDLAFQCSPDHPYVKEHPQWFRFRPDGKVQFAENPPKKYEDIFPLDFECDDWRSLWDELLSVVMYWVDLGVRIFRVDNPHTKPYAFWEWMIAEVRTGHPDVFFLAEAFARPKVMYRLAKLGFAQSYTYFTWRNTAWELREYFTELQSDAVREFFRPNLWPNTPDILPEFLQLGGRAAFAARAVLAATLGASWGIYGPAFELCANTPLESGREEYLDSEKYELVHYELERHDSLRHLISRLNTLRRENPALQRNRGLQFHPVDNPQLIAYSKSTEDGANTVLVVVNLDPHHSQSGYVDLPLALFGIDPYQPFQMHDLIGGSRYLWHGSRNFVELNPHTIPAHVFRLRRRVRTEHDFDYFL